MYISNININIFDISYIFKLTLTLFKNYVKNLLFNLNCNCVIIQKYFISFISTTENKIQ